MYPTKSMPGFGVFVKNVIEGLTHYNITIPYKVLIKGKGKNKYQKLYKYFLFYIQITIYFFKKYDAIYIHFPNHALPALLPLLQIKKRKIIVNLHGEDLLYQNQGIFNNLLGNLNDIFLQKANLIIVPSEYFKKELLKRKLCNEKNIYISPSGGIDKNKFYHIPTICKEETFCLGFVGRIDEGKGWKDFIEALDVLKKINFTFHGIIIGTGHQKEELHILINKYCLQDDILIINGISQEKLVNYYNQFDLLVFPSRLSESLGLVGIEAMACAVPVIGTDIGGIPSYLINSFNGYLVPVGSTKAIVSSIITFKNLSDSLKVEMKQNCLKTAENYFSDKVIEKLSLTIKSIL